MTDRSDSPCLIGIDVGTQSIRTLAFDPRGRKLAQAARPTPVRVLDGGRGEYDPDALFATVLACLSETLEPRWAAGRRPRRRQPRRELRTPRRAGPLAGAVDRLA